MMNNYTDYLCHHGIKGQKWGIRRFQNPDGSLTDEGRRRYLDWDGKITEEGMSELSENYNKNHKAEIAVIGTHVNKFNNAKDNLDNAVTKYAKNFGDDSELGKKQREYTNEWLDNNSGFDAAWFDRKNGWTDSRREQVEQGINLLAGEILDGPMVDMLSSGGKELGDAASAFDKEQAGLGKSLTDYANKAVLDTYGNLCVKDISKSVSSYEAKELLANVVSDLKVGDSYSGSYLAFLANSQINSSANYLMFRLGVYDSGDAAWEKAMEMATDYFKSRYPRMYEEYEWERDMGSAWSDEFDPTNDDLDFWRD